MTDYFYGKNGFLIMLYVDSKLNQMENSQKDKLFGCNLELYVNFEFTNLQLSTVAQIECTNARTKKRGREKMRGRSVKQLLFLFSLSIPMMMVLVAVGW